MPTWNVILHLLTIVFFGICGWMLALLKTASEESTKTLLRKLDWQAELAREIQKSRGVERQELRFKSYGALWKELRPLAIHDPAKLNRSVAAALTVKLTDWYFSECGGLFLTSQSRGFYFALQDLLRSISTADTDWQADRTGASEGTVAQVFIEALKNTNATEGMAVMEYFKNRGDERWQEKGVALGNDWSTAISPIGQRWTTLDEAQRFAVLQQVGSKLRSSLANDLESRMG